MSREMSRTGRRLKKTGNNNKVSWCLCFSSFVCERKGKNSLKKAAAGAEVANNRKENETLSKSVFVLLSVCGSAKESRRWIKSRRAWLGVAHTNLEIGSHAVLFHELGRPLFLLMLMRDILLLLGAPSISSSSSSSGRTDASSSCSTTGATGRCCNMVTTIILGHPAGTNNNNITPCTAE
jgi:hypothetical protein